MSAIFVLLNLLIIIFIVLFLINKQYILRPGRFGKYPNRNRAKWIVGSYGAILLISLIVLYFIPRDSFLPHLSNEERARLSVPSNYQNIVNALERHEIDSAEGIFAVKKWSYTLHDKELDLSSSDLTNFDIQIAVEKKANFKDNIEIVEYATRTYFNGIDFTDSIRSPGIQFDGYILKIIQPAKYTINLTDYSKEFTINQFTKSSDDTNYGSFLGYNPRVLYISIPEGVEVISGSLKVHFIGENSTDMN